MNTKTKTIIMISTIIVVSILAIGYIISVKKNESIQYSNQLSTPAGQSQAVAAQTKNAPLAPIATNRVSGTITKTTATSLSIKNGDANVDFALADSTLIYTAIGGALKKETVADLKVGTNVTVEINQKDSSVLSVEITK